MVESYYNYCGYILLGILAYIVFNKFICHSFYYLKLFLEFIPDKYKCHRIANP